MADCPDTAKHIFVATLRTKVSAQNVKYKIKYLNLKANKHGQRNKAEAFCA